jgi:hypothetical protein
MRFDDVITESTMRRSKMKLTPRVLSAGSETLSRGALK